MAMISKCAFFKFYFNLSLDRHLWSCPRQSLETHICWTVKDIV